MDEKLYQEILKELDEVFKKITNMSDDEFDEFTIACGGNLSVDLKEQNTTEKDLN